MAVTLDGLGRLISLIENDNPYGALGSGTLVPTTADTELDTEEIREPAAAILTTGNTRPNPHTL